MTSKQCINSTEKAMKVDYPGVCKLTSAAGPKSLSNEAIGNISIRYKVRLWVIQKRGYLFGKVTV